MTQETKSYSEQRAHDIATGTHYQLRTEFRADCEPIFMVLKPWLADWSECDGLDTNEDFTDPKKMKWVSRNWGGDTDVKFVMKAGSPPLSEIQWLINSIVDCHVAAESVALIEDYTGERMHYELFAQSATRPSKEVIEAAMTSIKDLEEALEARMERAAEAFQTLEAHIGNPEIYMHEVAMKQAIMLIKNGVLSDMNCDKLANVLYQNMTFDSNGTHVRLPGFKD